jgi:hypothetical protein
MSDDVALSHAQEIGALKAQVGTMKERLEKMDDKLDKLVAAANMGRGVWWLSMKLGGLAVMGMAGLAWLWQHIIHLIIPR